VTSADAADSLRRHNAALKPANSSVLFRSSRGRSNAHCSDAT